MSTRFFTESEVAERTRISLGTLRRWRWRTKDLDTSNSALWFATRKTIWLPGRVPSPEEGMVPNESRLRQQSDRSQFTRLDYGGKQQIQFAPPCILLMVRICLLLP
jgi:hypothetical protein